MAKEIPDIEFQYERGEERMTEFGAVIPEGWYKGVFSNLEAKETKKEGAGEWYVNLQCNVVEGPHKGSALFEMLFLWADNEKTAQATKRRLNTILEAVELPGMTKVNDLLDKEFMFKVKTQDAREVEDENTGEKKTYAARSQISNYKALSEYVADEPSEAKGPASKPSTPAKPKGPVFGAQKKAAEPAAEEAAEETKSAPASKPAGNKPPWVK